MKNLMLMAIAILFTMASCTDKKGMTVIGKIADDKAYEIQICDCNKNVLVKQALKEGGNFKLEVKDIKYPVKGSIKVLRNDEDVPTVLKRIVVEDGTMTLENTEDGKMGSLIGGKLNDELIRSWQESFEYRSAIKSWNDFKFAGRYIYQSDYVLLSTKLALKEMYYSLRELGLKAKYDILFAKLQNSSAAAQMIILQEIGVDKDNMKYIENIEKELGQSKSLEALKKKQRSVIKKMKAEERVVVGQPLVDFTYKSLKGKTITLSKVAAKNKYTLVAFEDANYYACRDQYRYMKKAYAKYKKSGLEIISVSMTKEKSDWLNNIKKEELTWIQCNDFKGERIPGFKAYLVDRKNLPANVLIDSKGNIIAKNLFGYGLKKKFKELFK